MSPEIIAALVAGGFLLVSTAASTATVLFSRRTSKSVESQGDELAKRFDETAKVVLVEGERASFDALTRLTLQEELRVSATRFSPRGIQRQRRYFDAMAARILGTSFEGEHHGKLESYYRLTSFNSEENKQSLIEMIEMLLSRDCNNLVLRVTADKNDFELLVFHQTRAAAICFHDLSKHDVVHSCLITRDAALFNHIEKFYQKVWNEDILLEVDFSLGEDEVRKRLETIRAMPPIEKSDRLSRIDSAIYEAEQKIEALRLIGAED